MLLYTIFDGLVLANLFMALVSTVLFCLVFRKAGHHWALGLLMLVPLVNIVMFVHLALGRWPLERQLAQARARLEELGHPLEETTTANPEAALMDLLCYRCRRQFRVAASGAGKVISCPECGTELKVPRPGHVPLRERIRSAFQRAQTRRKNI